MLRTASSSPTACSSTTYFRSLRGKVPYARGCGTPCPIATRSPSDDVIVHGWRMRVRMSVESMLNDTMLAEPREMRSIATSTAARCRSSASSFSVRPSIVGSGR